jgi:hypothetical protein
MDTKIKSPSLGAILLYSNQNTVSGLEVASS